MKTGTNSTGGWVGPREGPDFIEYIKCLASTNIRTADCSVSSVAYNGFRMWNDTASGRNEDEL